MNFDTAFFNDRFNQDKLKMEQMHSSRTEFNPPIEGKFSYKKNL